ncbi:MAG TPA: hypothetical protein VID19_13290 [Candidatus Eremiobacteraceae bacterium]
MRFAAIHSGPLLKWHATAIGKLLERPGTALAQRSELAALRSSRSTLAMLGYRSHGAMLDDCTVNDVPSARVPDGDLDFCIAFDSCAAAAAPPSRMGTWVFAVDGAENAPGLNAFCEQRDAVEARLLQIDSAGVVTCLCAGALGVNRFSLALTIDGLLEELSRWPAAALRDIEAGLMEIVPASPPAAAREPTMPVVARAVVALGLCRAAAIMEKRFYTFSWNIGIIAATPAQIVRAPVLPPVAWCEAGRRRFFADPFGAIIDGVHSAYCEEMNPSTNRGVILRLELVDGELQPTGRVLDESYHLSYPYVFEHESAWYAIPESGQNEEVALYRLENTGRAWRKQSVLIPGLRAVDSTVFSHAGKYWLLCGVNDDGPNHKLFVYYADALTGPWQPHLRNPVKVDIRSARPAGAPFLLDGVLHRPAQDCTRKYGRRVSIVRVNAIDERRYEEETIAVIEPPRGRYARGLHTLSAIGASTLIDGLHRDFSLRAAGRRTLRSFRRFFGARNERESSPPSQPTG